MLGGKAEVLHNLIARRGSAVVIDRNDGSFITGPALLAEACARFHSDALFQFLRQNTLAIRLVLFFEQIPARQADYARLHTVALQLFLRLHAERDFGARSDQ